MTEHEIVAREEWEAAMEKMRERDKEVTRLSDEVARERRELPWVRVEKDYSVETDAGRKSLADLFDGRSQLMVYHHMFGPHYEAGCPTCATMGDTIEGIHVHMAAKDVTLICVSAAPLEKLQAYKQRMGWTFGWASTHDSDFNFDLGYSHTDEEVQDFAGDAPPVVDEPAAMCGTDRFGYLTEAPGLTVWALEDGVVHQTYQTTSRGVEVLMGYYAALDRVPKGRDEDQEPFFFWFRRHDEY